MARFADDCVPTVPRPAARQPMSSGSGKRSGEDGQRASTSGGAEAAVAASLPSLGLDQDAGDMNDPLVPAPQVEVRRSKRKSKAPPPLAQFIEEAVVPCLQRAAGLPSSAAHGRESARVTATIVGEQGTRSRAIVLR